ncbi:VOC family protein [Amycolatopsis rhabdoformis]|uniref:VOC family protein n=1 Tax=Amycolatopsis rhabdoformis TaxID=1448059 RepID=A0ABZ1I856_9PSEU|nr:VOC family protein [Amycolatopsis rhabdoformis]WSE29845.1 VOC family protein [Amycolatopsis rhabdoformis]
MTEYTSPVPMPALDAIAPEPYRGIYGMPMFPTIPTADLAESKDFWLHGLGFIDLFSIPERLTHLRRWAFQDVLLVPGEPGPTTALTLSFSCVPAQLDEVVARCEELRPGCTSGPEEKPWNSLELTIETPEHVRVVFTAARPIDPDSAQAASLRAVGFDIPRG